MDIKRYLERMVLIGSAPLLGLAGAMTAHKVIDERAEVERSVAFLASQLVSLLEDDIAKRQAGLQMLADSPFIHEPADRASLRQLSVGYLASFGSHVTLVDVNLRMLMSTWAQPGQELPPVAVPRGRSALVQARGTGQPQVSDVVRTPWGPQDMVAVAVPVVRAGAVSHVLSTLIETAEIQRKLDAAPLPHGWRVRVLDSTGQLIAQAPAALGAGGRHADAFSLVREPRAAPWRVEVGIDRRAYWRQVVWAATPVIGGLLAAGVLAYAALRRAGRRLTQEVGALVQPEVTPQPITIREIASVRDRLQEVSAARDEAEARRLEDGTRLRDELQVRRALLDSALGAMNDGVWIGDAAGRTLSVNTAFTEMHRLSPEQAASASCEDWMASLWWSSYQEQPGDGSTFRLPVGERVPADQVPLRRALAGETVSSARYWVQHAQTGHRWFGSYSFAPIRDAKGQLSGTVVLVRDITPLLMTRAELERQRRELRYLLKQQGRIQERERKRIALELHDDLQQRLAAIRIDLATIAHQVERAPQEVPGSVAAAQAVVDSALEATRRIVRDLRPATLDQLGLVPALEAMLADFGDRTGTAYELEVIGPREVEPAIAPEHATCLFRIAQESVNNVMKHARASTVSLALDLSSPGHLRLRVEDDGVGLPVSPEALASGNGLQGMRERAAALGGSVKVTSRPEGGTRVEVDLPSEA